MGAAVFTVVFTALPTDQGYRPAIQVVPALHQYMLVLLKLTLGHSDRDVVLCMFQYKVHKKAVSRQMVN